MKVFVTEIDLETNKHKQYFIVDIDGGKKEWCYRGRGRHNTFFHNKKRYNYAPNFNDALFLYHVQSEEDKKVSTDLLVKALGYDPFAEIPKWEFKNINDFFVFIGFDYKTKTWI